MPEPKLIKPVEIVLLTPENYLRVDGESEVSFHFCTLHICFALHICFEAPSLREMRDTRVLTSVHTELKLEAEMKGLTVWPDSVLRSPAFDSSSPSCSCLRNAPGNSQQGF